MWPDMQLVAATVSKPEKQRKAANSSDVSKLFFKWEGESSNPAKSASQSSLS